MKKELKLDYLASLATTISSELMDNVIIFCGDCENPFFKGQKMKEKEENASSVYFLQPELPKMLYEEQHKVCLIDCGRYFLDSAQYQNNILNWLFFLTFGKKIQIVLLFTNDDTEDQRKDMIIKSLKSLSALFFSKVRDRKDDKINTVIDSFAKIFSFSIINPEPNIQYQNRFQIIKSSNALPEDENNFIKNILNSVLDDKKIFLENSVSEILKTSPGTSFSQDNIKDIFKYSHSMEQKQDIKKLKENIFGQYHTSFAQLKEWIENRDENSKLSQILPIFEKNIHIKTLKLLHHDKPLKTTQIQMNTDLFLFGQFVDLAEFIDKKFKQGGNVDISVFGEVLKVLGSFKCIACADTRSSSKLYKMGEIISFMKKIYQNVPYFDNVKIESQNFYDQFSKTINQLIKSITKNFETSTGIVKTKLRGSNKVSKLNEVIKAYQVVIDACKKVETIEKFDFKDSMQNYISYFFQYLVERKLSFYHQMVKFWKQDKTIQFLLKLEGQIYDSLQYIFGKNKKLMISALKDIYGYLGNKCFKKNKFEFAENLFLSGYLLHSLYELEIKWLQELFHREKSQTQIKTQNIQSRVKVLVKLGFFEEALKWIYKFQEIIDFSRAEQLTIFMCEIANTGIQDHKQFCANIKEKAEVKMIERNKIASIKESLIKQF